MAEKDSAPSPEVSPRGAPVVEKKDDGLRTPHEHAVAQGQYKDRGARPGAVVAAIGDMRPADGFYSIQHNAAAALHGWSGDGDGHEHHAGEPIRISEAAYKAALVAAFNPVTRKVLKEAQGDKPRELGPSVPSEEAAKLPGTYLTDYEPHAAAESPHSPHKRKA